MSQSPPLQQLQELNPFLRRHLGPDASEQQAMLSALGQHPQAVLDELERRFGLSGHDEKAARQPSA